MEAYRELILDGDWQEEYEDRFDIGDEESLMGGLESMDIEDNADIDPDYDPDEE